MSYEIIYRRADSGYLGFIYCSDVTETFREGGKLLKRYKDIVEVHCFDPANEPPISVEMLRKYLAWRAFYHRQYAALCLD